jgi:uncharacterized lipoprotein
MVLALTACGGTQTYSSIDPGAQPARSRANLELPPDLVQTSSDSLAAAAEQDASSEQVLPDTAAIEVERNDAEGWLDVQAPADRVWNRLVSHWGSLGVDLIVADPKGGIMETDWVKPARSEEESGPLSRNYVGKFLGRVVDTPTSLDKYTIRLERKSDSETRVHVSHRGVRKIQTEEASVARNAQWEWVETAEDPDKVRRALSSIVYGLDNGTS